MKTTRYIFSRILIVIAVFALAANALAFDLNIRGIDDSSRPVTLSDWRGKHVVLTMAYSECRRVCTTTLKLLNNIQVAADKTGKSLDIVVVSLDPKIDSPESWRKYRDMHNVQFSNWHFVTADQATTVRLAKQLGLEYWRYDEHVMHTLRIVRIAPNGDIAASIDWQNRDIDAFLTDLPSAKSQQSN